MKPKKACFTCLREQALRSLGRASGDPEHVKLIKKKTALAISSASSGDNPPLIATGIFLAVNELTGNPDPYLPLKKKYNEIVRDEIKKIHIKDIMSAAKHAINGNIIDFGIADSVELDVSDDFPLAIDDSKNFLAAIASSKKILYLCDNAGEIGFDRVLMDRILESNPAVRITAVVKSGAIINDATVEDARYFGIDGICDIDAPAPLYVGTQMALLGDGFRSMFRAADAVISKGQANWESLDGVKHPAIFYLLRAKCAVVAEHLGVPLGSAVLKQG